jgi:hypothetical protein
VIESQSSQSFLSMDLGVQTIYSAECFLKLGLCD